MRTWPPCGQRRVVLGGQRPAQLLRAPRRHRGGQHAARPQHAGELGHGADVVGDVLEHLGADDAVEGVVGEREAQCVPVDAGAQPVGRGLALLPHGPEQVTHGWELVEAVVQGHHLGATAEALEGVPPGAGAHVQHQVALAQAEPVVVDGEHGSASDRGAGCGGGLVQQGPVVLHRALRGVAPAPAVDDAVPSGPPDALGGLRVLQHPPDARRPGPRCRPGPPRSRSRRRRRTPPGWPRRWCTPAGRWRSWPRWPAGRSPRRGTARRRRPTRCRAPRCARRTRRRRTRPRRPGPAVSMVRWAADPSLSRPTMTSFRSGYSVRSLARASSR